MVEQAIQKINGEMVNNPDGTVKRIGDFLIAQLNLNPDSAVKILNPDKTIIKSIDHMRDEARKQVPKDFKGKSYGATLTDEEGLQIVLKYYGIKLTIEKEDTKKVNDIFATLDSLLK